MMSVLDMCEGSLGEVLCRSGLFQHVHRRGRILGTTQGELTIVQVSELYCPNLRIL